jgi:hypothetical protein
VLPADPAGFPTDPAPMPTLPARPPETPAEWERALATLKAWGVENAYRVGQWSGWWASTKALYTKPAAKN